MNNTCRAWALASLLAATCVLGNGCAKALMKSNNPSKERVRIVASQAEGYTIVVADENTYQVPTDGRLTLDIPRLPSGCATYVFGVKVASESSYDVPAIDVKKGGESVRKLSLNDVARLEKDEQGYRVLKLR